VKYFDFKPATTDRLEDFERWANDMRSRFTDAVGRKIEVRTLPEVGETRVQWYHEAFSESDGEFVTVEVWDGDSWRQHGLDVHMTLEDLDRLNEELGGEL
jgi:hypothetical protein